MSKNVSWDEQGNWDAKGEWGTRDSAGRKLDLAHWQARLDALRAEHHVPAASLAVLVDGTVHELASGVLHRGTGVEATTDSVFQMGSIAKVYTATLIMRLVESGQLDLDAPVVDVLPEFSVADPEATRAITTRQLLSHTSGLTCDFTYDSGRGDDCLAKYVEAAKDVALDCPPGTAISYSSVGYNVLGRIVEVVTGKVWDEALKDLLLTPLGVTHTMTLPEEALRFRAAMGHLGEAGQDPDPAPSWDLMPRSAGPYGRVIATAGDVARLARMHLNGGVAQDGTRVLSEETVALMQRGWSTPPTSGPSARTVGAWAGPCTTGTASRATATTAPPSGSTAICASCPRRASRSRCSPTAAVRVSCTRRSTGNSSPSWPG